MTTDCPLLNSGYTAQIPFHFFFFFDTAGGATLNSSTEFTTEPHAQFLCCSSQTTNSILNAAKQHQFFSYTFFFFFKSHEEVNLSKVPENKFKNINQYQIVLILLQFNSSLTFVLFDIYTTGQYFNRLDDPNTPLLKRLLLFSFTQWTETDRKAMEDLRFFSKPVSVFVNYLK